MKILRTGLIVMAATLMAANVQAETCGNQCDHSRGTKTKCEHSRETKTQASRGERGNRPRSILSSPKLIEALELSETQIAALEELEYDHRMEAIDLGADLKQAELKLERQMKADDIDERMVKQSVAEVTGLRGQLFQTKIENRLAQRALLSDEQREQFDNMKQKRPGNRSPRAQRVGKRGGR